MAHSRWLIALALTALPSACSQAEKTDEPISDLSAAVSSARAETTRYARTCVDATSLGMMNDEFGRHRARMQDLIESMETSCAMLRGEGAGMTHGMMSMHACRDPLFQDLDGKVSDLSAEMSDYVSAMHDADALDQARTACQNHNQHMLDLLDPMLDDVRGMLCTGSP